MKFLLKSLLLTLLLYIMLKYAIFFFNTGHDINYNIGNFSINEKLNTKENNNYYFSIKSEKINFNFQINENYNKAKKILKKIYYQNIDSYKCILPIFKDNKIITDIMCIKDNTIYNAHDLNNTNIEKEFKKYNYNPKIYKDKSEKVVMSNTQTLYKNNLPKNDYIALESYKGLTLFNSKESRVKLFDNDVYKKPISIFTDKYYVVADYNKEYTFKNFYVVNIVNGQVNNIRSYNDISFDSYIQGAVDNEIYLFDKESQKQYKLNIESESVDEIGDKDNIKYYNGKWSKMTLKEALNEKKFENHYVNIKGYEKAEIINNYYYMYKKENDKYLVYRSDKQNKKLKTYLFETTNLNSIIYLQDKIYYQNKNDFCYYSKTGTRKILTNTELEFNNDISLGAYKK